MYATRYTNPKAVGYVIRQLVRCGDPTCRCARCGGHEAHYLVYRVREDGRWRQRKRYVRKADVTELRRRLAAAKAQDRALKALLEQGRILRAAIRARSRGKLSDCDLLEVAHEIRGC